MVNKLKTRIVDLFKGVYLKRRISVWFIWIRASSATYGLTGWATSAFRIVYHLPVERSLTYDLILSGVSLAGTHFTICLIEAIRQRLMFIVD